MSVLTAFDCTFKGVQKKNNLKYQVVFDWEIWISDFAIEREFENLLARPLLLKTVFQILFRISQSNDKIETSKTDATSQR